MLTKEVQLDREKLWEWGVSKGDITFVSSSAHLEQELKRSWQDEQEPDWRAWWNGRSSVPPVTPAQLAAARALFSLPTNYSQDDVAAAFRQKVMKAHPDKGGSAEQFNLVVNAKDQLLAALGT